MLFLVYSNEDGNAKSYKAKRYYLPKGIIKNYNIINGKSVHNQAIHTDIKRHKDIRKLKTRQSEDYTSRYLLDYIYIKNYYKFTAVDVRKQKE